MARKSLSEDGCSHELLVEVGDYSQPLSPFLEDLARVEEKWLHYKKVYNLLLSRFMKA